MIDQALSTLPRDAKGPIAPPPLLGGTVQAVADAVAAWPGVEATTHWLLNDHTRIDGIDLYVGPEELGHIHLDGSIHLATTPHLQTKLVGEGLGKAVSMGERVDTGQHRPVGRGCIRCALPSQL